MITRLWERERKSTSSVAISVAVHVVLIAALATITFRYPLAEMFNDVQAPRPVPVRYVALKARAGSAEPDRAPARTPSAPMPKVTSIPVGVPSPPAPVSPTPATTAIGAGGSTAAASRDPGIGFGLRPGIPDGRLATNPASSPRVPETETAKAERILSSIYQEYLDSARAAINNPGRKPGDLSFGGKDGDRWGWDENGIHVGGVTIPNMVLAALPIPITPGTEPVAFRQRDFVRNDIALHAGVMTRDEFKAAVQRVRDRVDRERRERMEREAARAKKDPPCC